ncbi:hypothetical protein F4781DRAFT_233328 [Annulohypoxylon bovei var. microspora]|nr:hypothetical protein F4781DRAFT_233328 [Annulohypoxylon bovei var. microspora]
MVPVPTSQSSAAAGAPGNHNTTGSNDEYEEALDKLQPLQPVLRGFNHRNRNQHRRAAWWAPFGMLRRHVEKLVDELLDLAATAAKSKNKKRKRGDESDNRAERKVRDHVKWLRDLLVPKCYIAFSQLTADNQFATLGVVLLGALAQVNAACIQLVGEVVVAAGEGDSSTLLVHELASSIKAVKESSSSTSKEPPLQGHNGTSKTLSQQIGAVVSRDQVARAEKLRRKNILPEEGDQSGSANVPDSARKNLNHNCDTTFIEKQHSTATKGKAKRADNTATKEGLKLAKKKKTKKGGDEFDNLFKGLF